VWHVLHLVVCVVYNACFGALSQNDTQRSMKKKKKKKKKRRTVREQMYASNHKRLLLWLTTVCGEEQQLSLCRLNACSWNFADKAGYTAIGPEQALAEHQLQARQCRSSQTGSVTLEQTHSQRICFCPGARLNKFAVADTCSTCTAAES